MLKADCGLVIAKTGFLKNKYLVGLHREYRGTTGRIKNCQLSAFPLFASGHGRALIDRELYLPKDWSKTRSGAGQRR